jgi:GNAT superfamily N-acetyltransferase
MKERGVGGIVESAHGFATYHFTEEGGCYIEDIYITPEMRKDKNASLLADSITEIAKERGCTHLIGSVVPSANNSTISLKVLLGYGFTLVSSDKDLIWFRKEI